MGQNIMRNCDLREFHALVNLPSPIRHVLVPIWHVITLIPGLPNLIRQVVPLISHIPSYSTHHSHLHPPSLSFSSTTLPSLQNTKLSHPSLSPFHDHALTPSTGIHRVLHTPSTAYTQDCLSSLHSHDYELAPECSFSLRRASLHDRLLSATAP